MPKEVPVPRSVPGHLVGHTVGGSRLPGETREAQALETIVEETVAGWEKWSIEEEELMVVEENLQLCDGEAVAGGSAGGGGVVAQETPSTRPPVIVPSGRRYPVNKDV